LHGKPNSLGVCKVGRSYAVEGVEDIEEYSNTVDQYIVTCRSSHERVHGSIGEDVHGLKDSSERQPRQEGKDR
jgi:hypothetical protein